MKLDTSPLRNALARMQEARHQCQAWETSLEALKDEVDIAHEELDHLERLLINNLRPNAPELSEIYKAETERSFMPKALLRLREEPEENYHPLYLRFLSAVSDYSHADEEYKDNLQRKAEIEDRLYRHELLDKYQQGHSTYNRQLDI